MDKKSLENFIRNFYQAWRNKDSEKIITFYDENVTAQCDYKKITLTDMMNRADFSRRKFSESHYNIEDIIVDAEAGKIVVKMNQDHILKDGTGSIKCQAIMLYKIVNNKIVDICMSFYPNIDYLDNN